MTSLPDRRRTRMSQKQLRGRLQTLRRQQAHKARARRRRRERIHAQLPEPVHSVFDPLVPAFSRPTHRRFVLLALAAILTLGGRTVSNLLRVLGALAPGHPTSYHRVFSRSRWSPWVLGAASHTPSSTALCPKAPSRWLATTP